MNLNKRETATVLAALRQFQTIPSEAYPHFEDCDPLTPKQIDRLCERINTDHEPKILKKPLGKRSVTSKPEGDGRLMNYKCKNPRCPSKGKAQDTIGVVSQCTQTLALAGDDWSNLEIGDTISGYCLECAAKIPPKTMTKLIDNAGT